MSLEKSSCIFYSDASKKFSVYAVCMTSLELLPSELQEAQAAGEPLVLLDVREPWEWDKARIPGSLLMPMGDVPSRAHQELDPDGRIVVVCHHGVRSLNTAVWLRNQGFENAQSLAGGIDAWALKADPTTPRY